MGKTQTKHDKSGNGENERGRMELEQVSRSRSSEGAASMVIEFDGRRMVFQKVKPDATEADIVEVGKAIASLCEFKPTRIFRVIESVVWEGLE